MDPFFGAIPDDWSYNRRKAYLFECAQTAGVFSMMVMFFSAFPFSMLTSLTLEAAWIGGIGPLLLITYYSDRKWSYHSKRDREIKHLKKAVQGDLY